MSRFFSHPTSMWYVIAHHLEFITRGGRWGKPLRPGDNNSDVYKDWLNQYESTLAVFCKEYLVCPVLVAVEPVYAMSDGQSHFTLVATFKRENDNLVKFNIRVNSDFQNQIRLHVTGSGSMAMKEDIRIGLQARLRRLVVWDFKLKKMVFAKVPRSNIDVAESIIDPR